MNLDTDSVASRLLEMVGGEQRAIATHEGIPANPSPWLVEFFGGGAPAAGVQVNERTALSASAVFACVRNLAEDIAKLPFITYRSLDPHGKERLKDHPLYRLLHDEPNPEMSSFDFRQAVTACGALFGGGYAEIERTRGGVPLYLWPIEPWRVRPRRDPAGNLFYQIDGRERLDAGDVLHIKGFGFDGVLGAMLAQVGRESLGLTLAAQKFAAGFFGNGTRLSGILTHPKVLSDKARENIRASWEKDYGGVENAFKMKLLEEGVTWTPTSSPPEEAQMLETRQFQVEDVARWFRMPPHKIQHLLRSTFSNIEHQGIEYVVDTMLPWCVRWEQETKRKLVSKSEPDVFPEHLVDGLLRGDALSRSQALEIQARNGIINADEWRALENRNPLPDGKGQVYLVPMNMTTIDRMIEGPPEPLATDAAPASQNEPPPKDDASTLPPDEQRTLPLDGERRAMIAEAHRPALLDAAARVLRREVEVIKRKAKNPETFSEGITAFYAGHDEYVRTAIRPAVTAYARTLQAVSGEATDAELSVGRVVASHLGTVSLAWLADHVIGDSGERELQEWEARRAAQIVDSILQTTEPKTP